MYAITISPATNKAEPDETYHSPNMFSALSIITNLLSEVEESERDEIQKIEIVKMVLTEEKPPNRVVK